MILIAVPVLGRPWRAAPLVEAAHEATTVDHRILFLCSPGDDAEIAACEATDASVVVVPWESGMGDFARKINYAVKVSDEPWILMGADDLCFCPFWAEKAIECGVAHHAGVVGTQDWGNSRVMAGEHSTHPVVSREYIMKQGTIDEPGKMLHEGYGHQYCDDELVVTARMRRSWVFCYASEVPHLHPDWGKSEDDATYRKGRASFEHDRVLFEERQKLWLRSGSAIRKPR